MLTRFCRYVKFETRSDEASPTLPSTPQQKDFARMLEQELRDLGLTNVFINDAWFVNATLPSNVGYPTKTIGFISHYDTADFNAVGVNPQVVHNYDGSDIVLNKEQNIVMQVSNFPNLNNYIGKTLITTDGTTLLGADDKAGITEIIEALIYLQQHPEIPHGDIRVAFGPDEEIGRGADYFNVAEFNADFAYTLDAGPLGELEYESFNAAQIVYEITGVSVHPGTAKDRMINANTVAVELASLFPNNEVPEKTEGYEGFFMLHHMDCRIEKARLCYIIRDHDRAKFEARKAFAVQVAQQINQKYGDIVTYSMKDQYYNMGDVIKKDMTPVLLAKQAMENLGIKPLIHPIRGGTDGSKISYMGLPTPNIFVGGENFHGQYEFACLEDMLQARDTIVEIVRLNAVQAKPQD